ncbi:mannitol dehydrogenase family protein [Demequina aurantiaca]|uniref:mannitol dehydrogenase family protein n=1 Tax=Demequina aurantiaca TaxID=676200 RepID=UPI003D3347DD
MSPANPIILSRSSQGLQSPRVRIVHLGLGAFHRAHEAWYTAHSSDASEWGIAAFTGRSAQAAEVLSSQDGLYCLVTRGATGDQVEVVSSIVAAHSGAELDALASYLGRSEVAILSTTVTEAGYRLTASGGLNTSDPELEADMKNMLTHGIVQANPTTALGRLLFALQVRRSSGAGPISVVPCDNVPDNGWWLRTGLLALAAHVDETLVGWIQDNVSFVSTSVDRITPRSVPSDEEAAQRAGWLDVAPVVTEPFSDWTLCGVFPAGRPDWESAGARFVEDILPYERRKLWLLNGAHSLIAAAGLNRGHESVSEASADAEVWAMVEAFWEEGAAHLPGIEHVAYRASLRERFNNPRIVHLLTQIAGDASTKFQVRTCAVAAQELAAGRDGAACAIAIAEWAVSTTLPRPASDTRSAQIAMASKGRDPVLELVRLLSDELASTPAFVAQVRRHAAHLQSTVVGRA